SGRLWELHPAARDHRSRWRRHHRADIPVGRLVEVDDDRRMVAGTAALPRLPVDPGGPHPSGHRLCRQAEVQPHAHVLVEHPRTGPFGTYADCTRTPAQTAAIARASWCGKPGPSGMPTTTSSNPTRESTATPFH